MLPDRVSNPGPLTYESGALPIALRGPASLTHDKVFNHSFNWAKPAPFFVVYTVTNHPLTKDTICRCRST